MDSEKKWISLPDKLIEKIWQRFGKNRSRSVRSLHTDIFHFVTQYRGQTDDILEYYMAKANHFSESKLYNALNRRKPWGIFCEGTERNMADLLCYYASSRDSQIIGWYATLEQLGYDEKDLIFKKEEAESSHSKKHQTNPKVYEIIAKMTELMASKHFVEAEELYFKGIKLAETENDEYGKARLDQDYAVILHHTFSDDAKSYKILCKVLKTFEALDAKEDIASTQLELARVSAFLGDHISSDIYNTAYLEYKKSQGDLFFLGSAYINSARLNDLKYDYETANSYSEEAIKIGMKLMHKGGRNKLLALTILAKCHVGKSGRHFKLGELIEAKASCIKALEYFAQLDQDIFLWDFAASLLMIAEIEIAEGLHDTGRWEEYLEEAKTIYRTLKDYVKLASCIDFQARTYLSIGQKSLSFEAYKEGYSEILKSRDSYSIAHFIEVFIEFSIEQNQYEEATKLLNDLLDLANDKDLPDFRISAYQNLFHIAHLEDNEQRKKYYIDKLLVEYNETYKGTQNEIEQASILAQIATVYAQINKHREALNLFEKILKIYENKKQYKKVAMVHLNIGDTYIRLKNDDFAFKHWNAAIETVSGTSFYDIDAQAKFRCGQYYTVKSDFVKAKYYLDDAAYLINKYKLPGIKPVENLLVSIQKYMPK